MCKTLMCVSLFLVFLSKLKWAEWTPCHGNDYEVHVNNSLCTRIKDCCLPARLSYFPAGTIAPPDVPPASINVWPKHNKMLLCAATVCDGKHMYHHPRSTGRGSSPATRHHLLLYDGKLTVTRNKKTQDSWVEKIDENKNMVACMWSTCRAYGLHAWPRK
jgi:hypothetical protein